MRFLYTTIWILLLPCVLLRLYWRGRKEPGYRKYITERLGCYLSTNRSYQPTIWVHAVSVGETRAAEPLIITLQKKHPQHHILLTHMTATGRETGKQLFDSPSIQQAFLPYDIPYLLQGFLNHFKPCICILMETEVWPNLIHTCKKNSIPVILANARLSKQSYRKAFIWRALIREASQGLKAVYAQTAADAKRIKRLGASSVTVVGNTKFDVTFSSAQSARGHQLHSQLKHRSIILCASTREGEEEAILEAYRKIAQKWQHLAPLLVIVPRHPQRFSDVEALIKTHHFSMMRRSQLASNSLPPDVEVLLGDTMGELIAYYISADISLVAGSLLPFGGHNIIEALEAACPVFVGPHTFNFASITKEAIHSKCAIRVNNAEDFFMQSMPLIEDTCKRTQMGEVASLFIKEKRGAAKRMADLLSEYITTPALN